MKHGEYKLARQLGMRGFFGKVVLSIDAGGEEGAVKVEFDSKHAAEWQVGAQFGIDYVLERLSTHDVFPKGAIIHIESIQGHPVDTTNAVIAFAAANALLNALELDVSKARMPTFDEERGLFEFA